MKKILALVLIASALILSGCVGQQKTVKLGDNVTIDYIGRTEDGKIFDTTIENIAKQNDIYFPNKTYQPLKFIVGKGMVMKGLDEDVIGMKVGDKKTFTIPPEKGYGQIDPGKIQIIPLIQSAPLTIKLNKSIDVPTNRFEMAFGTGHKIGDVVTIPNTNINLTVKGMGNDVLMDYNLKIGDKVLQNGAPWNMTVVSVDDNIMLKEDAVNGTMVNLQNAPWNSTVIGINNTNITLRHNPIPDKEIQGIFGSARIHFNETSIIIDQNNKLAGKTLIFDVTLNSID